MKKILVVDGVNTETEEFETLDEAKSWIKECFTDKDEGIHPDIESVKIYEQKYITDVVEAEDGYKVIFNEIESVPAETLVMPKIADIKQKIKEHFESENIILDNAKDEMNDKEYEYRKEELVRQKFYIMLILSNFTA